MLRGQRQEREGHSLSINTLPSTRWGNSHYHLILSPWLLAAGYHHLTFIDGETGVLRKWANCPGSSEQWSVQGCSQSRHVPPLFCALCPLGSLPHAWCWECPSAILSLKNCQIKNLDSETPKKHCKYVSGLILLCLSNEYFSPKRLGHPIPDSSLCNLENLKAHLFQQGAQMPILSFLPASQCDELSIPSCPSVSGLEKGADNTQFPASDRGSTPSSWWSSPCALYIQSGQSVTTLKPASKAISATLIEIIFKSLRQKLTFHLFQNIVHKRKISVEDK